LVRRLYWSSKRSKIKFDKTLIFYYIVNMKKIYRVYKLLNDSISCPMFEDHFPSEWEAEDYIADEKRKSGVYLIQKVYVK
jgi:hypothetical protein